MTRVSFLTTHAVRKKGIRNAANGYAEAQTKSSVAEKLPKNFCAGEPGVSDTKPLAAKASQTPAPQSDICTRQIKPTQDRIVFMNNKGDVTFTYTLHLRSMDKVQCLLCHQTDNPNPEAIHSRLDDHRTGHGFCRGCHQKSGKGPLNKCRACHDYKNKN